jgi:hypothetical protein
MGGAKWGSEGVRVDETSAKMQGVRGGDNDNDHCNHYKRLEEMTDLKPSSSGDKPSTFVRQGTRIDQRRQYPTLSLEI